MTADEDITDLYLPITSVTRLIKDALPNGAQVNQDAKLSIARCASIFVLYLTSASIDVTTTANQRTITPNQVFNALKEIKFANFIPELEKSLENHRKVMENKKERKSINSSTENPIVIDDDDDVIELLDDDD